MQKQKITCPVCGEFAVTGEGKVAFSEAHGWTVLELFPGFQCDACGAEFDDPCIEIIPDEARHES